jgi:hypothetical protein
MLRLGTAVSVAAFFIIALTWPAPASAQVALDCDYFNFWEQAQAVYEEDDTDPNFLDEDGDGIACPDLPEAGLDPVMPDLPASGDYSCVDFPYQELAQEVYDEDPTDPHNLDPTGDGVACSRLPLLADFAADEELTGEELPDESALEDEFADDELTDEELTDEELTDEALTDEELSGEAVEGDTDSAGPLTEEEREARRAARRAARQAEREAAEETPADE